MDYQTKKRFARNNSLQKLCRRYLSQLKPIAKKHCLDGWVNETIALNKNKRCKATESEVELLARCVNDERLQRNDIAPLLGKSYRQTVEDEDFERIKKLPTTGIYSKVDATLYKETINIK